MIKIPFECPRGLKDCISLANIISDDKRSFYCCGENNGDHRTVKQDKYTTCFKGPHRDEMCNSDKRDLVHRAATILQAIAVIEKDVTDQEDWSPWK